MYVSQCACSRTVRYDRVLEACNVSPAGPCEAWRNAVPVRALTHRHALFAKWSYYTSYAAPFVVACTPSLRSVVPAVHSAASIAVAMTVPCPSIPAHYSAWYAYERSSKECARAFGDDSIRCVTWQRQAMCQQLYVAHASNALSNNDCY